ncbi:MAG: ATP-binding protein [Nitrosopumilaceae archaeon]|nr:ATP-binding protein [Nitrosopumilaceae archaeon]
MFRTFHRMQVHVTPVRPDDAQRKMSNRELLYTGVKTSRADIQKKLRDIQALKKDLELGNTSAFTFIVNGFIFAKTRKELVEINKQVRRNVAAMNVRITSGYGMQRRLVEGTGTGASWLGAIGSMHVLYPFASADMLEAPNGVLLGRNQDTSGPVIYDVNLRKNHNIFTCGTTGSGKSFTNKILLKRFLENRPGTPCMIIDPQGEYLPHAKYFGLDAIEVEAGRQFGLDPFDMLDTPVEAADLLGSATGAKSEIRKEWRSICDSVRSIEELHGKSSEAGKRCLADLVKGSVSEVFRGEPRFSDRMIISLKKTDGQEYEGLLIMLVLAYAWRRVNELPANRWKFVLLDEAWRVTKLEQSILKIGEMVRQGRKRSMIFAVSTQQFSDLDRALADESKLTELFDTKIVMQLSRSAVKAASEALDLTEREMERITNFRPGTGLLQTSGNSVYLKFEATADETRNYFNTKAEKEGDRAARPEQGEKGGDKPDPGKEGGGGTGTEAASGGGAPEA